MSVILRLHQFHVVLDRSIGNKVHDRISNRCTGILVPQLSFRFPKLCPYVQVYNYPNIMFLNRENESFGVP
jgi:hypothetical protein